MARNLRIRHNGDHTPCQAACRDGRQPLCLRRARMLFLVAAMALVAVLAGAQNPTEPAPAPDEAPAAPPMPEQSRPAEGGAIPVRGVVRDALSGEALPRALVQVDGETGPGTLTDRDGQFELLTSGAGAHVFQLTKPGYHDLPPSPAEDSAVLEYSNGITHNILVVRGMPELSLSMMPTSAIQGQIDLSTGDNAQGIGVLLLRRVLVGGHGAWVVTGNQRTNTDGAYRFPGLDPGDYAVVTEPARESEIDGISLAPDGSAPAGYNGYAPTYYPDARDLAGAAKIRVRGGETVQANISLRLEAFQPVQAAVTTARLNGKIAAEYNATVVDAQGHTLPYPAVYDPETRTVVTALPDGTYGLQVAAVPRIEGKVAAIRGTAPGGGALQGSLDITVAGHPVTGVRLPLAERSPSIVSVSVSHNAALQTSTSRAAEAVTLGATQAGDARVDGMWLQFAQGAVPGELEGSALPPGAYWMHTNIAQAGICEQSFTAGGASLAREPLVITPGNMTPPLTLSLRDDCASLTLTLPPDSLTAAMGEEKAYTVYVVPDFDSTVDLTAQTLRPSSGGSIVVHNLTPGSYHVYAFQAPVELEYRNPDAMAKLPNSGQSITLQPSSDNTLTLEAPSR
ncbi:carboxypeptidase-like regulatory domain-containing protein [Acidobacteria bacterium AB60]|nr:carboxypeptidase-like regulatory domain-containing protein [Acidobacteria bacterium AB60]